MDLFLMGEFYDNTSHKDYKLQRQFDIPLTDPYFFSLPADAPGRTTADDYIYFDFCSIVPYMYDVVVESANGDFLKVCELQAAVKMPHVHFNKGSLVLVVPKSDMTLPRFVGTMQRGKRYHLYTSIKNVRGDYFIMT
jgi:hypothetical protein